MQDNFKNIVKNILEEMGAEEIKTSLFINNSILDDAGIDEDSWEREAVRLEGSQGEEPVALRTILTPGMLDMLGRNCLGGMRSLRYYEIGSTFMPSMTRSENNGFPEESEDLTIGICGGGDSFTILKEMIENFLSNLGIENVIFEPEAEYGVYNPKKCVRIILDIGDENNGKEKMAELEEKVNNAGNEFGEAELQIMKDLVAALSGMTAEEQIEIGIMGEIHSDVAERFGISKGACCEIHFETLEEFASKEA
ncbi:hypothetical protein [Gallibacter intestinalis]|uniref:Phenylalanyl tRNA synthetase beta chain core domain-containing protein n=1 Tax=Gallibacter intestinalis TaxID=2779356 RepID=A0ABR9QYY0_9FIRM|nr:hypothetical protein [Gallibacter intestinalis]MBE5035785.1 hypothetical protein [Gallibacter intestinalis]